VKIRKILWALTIGILSVKIAGCACPDKVLPPVIPIPDRPQLENVNKVWPTIPAEARGVLSRNQEKIFEYVEKLELGLEIYEQWRISRTVEGAK
jgi:hypothetical protein